MDERPPVWVTFVVPAAQHEELIRVAAALKVTVPMLLGRIVDVLTSLRWRD